MRKNRSDAVHIMFSCSAFANIGLNVSLVVPHVQREEYIIENSETFGLYGLVNNFEIVELPTNIKEDKHHKSSALSTVLQKFLRHFAYALKNRGKLSREDTVIYSKCYISGLPYIILKKLGLIKSPFAFETLYVKNSLLHNIIIRNSDIVVTFPKALRKKLEFEFGLPKNRIFKTPMRLVIPKEREQAALSKDDCRQHHGFNANNTYIMYGGKTGETVTEVNYFIEAAQRLPGYKFVIVGANDVAMEYYESKQIDNLLIYPFQPLEEYIKFTKAADILVAYYPSTEYNKYYLGPGKSGSYLDSSNPVIFSDLPSLRERFSDDIVYFSPPDDVNSLVNSIKHVANNMDEGRAKALKASKFIEKHTFENAAIAFCKMINAHSWD